MKLSITTMEPNNILLLLVLFVFVSGNEGHNLKGVGAIDSILESLAKEPWDQAEGACLRDTTALLNGVKNQTLWASWVWNSMQLPVGTFYGSKFHLGNFDQCLQMPWSNSNLDLRMQYCLVDVKLNNLKKYSGELIDPYGSAERYLEMESSYGTRFNSLFLGVCLPASCKPASIAKISRHIHGLSHLSFENIEVDPRDCQVAGQILERAPEFYVFLYTIMFTTLVCILVYYMANVQDSNSIGPNILRCFCLTRNFDALNAKTAKEEVKMMHGMRTLTSGALIVMHYIISDRVLFANYLDFEKDLTNKFGRMTLHLDACVDTFFVMSGLLHFKGLISARTVKPFKILFKRYLRLLVPFTLTIICYGYVLPHLGSGPAWPRLLRRYSEPCANMWWKNLLMMGNKVNDKGFCVPVSWYIHCDYQLAVFATIIFLIYRRSKAAALILSAVTYFLSVAIPTLLNYWNKAPGILFYNFGEASDLIENKVYGSVYVHSYTRASSYLIGMGMGYLMTVYKPQEYRKIISKTFSIIGFIFGFSLMLLVLHIGANMFDKVYTTPVMSVLAALDRSIWSLGICIIIIVCEYGTLPIINDFLSSNVFVPLSKLSYSNYMCHTVFILRYMLSLRAAPSFDFFQLIIDGLGYVVICYCFSYLFWLFVEGPVANLINLAFENRSTKPSRNGGKENIADQNGLKTINGVQKVVYSENGVPNGENIAHNDINGAHNGGVKHKKIL